MSTVKRRSSSAFSLVELAIVLVILGLLVGGVLSGRSLIRASELRSVTSEYQRYVAAINTFRDKYFALPGDLNNAASIWTGASNGNGNGHIDGDIVAATNETSHFWAQLALAGLIEGSYTAGSWDAVVPGTTNPAAKLPTASWNIRWLGVVPTDDNVCGASGLGQNVCYEGNYGNAFFFTSETDFRYPWSGPVLRAEEAWNIDTKMDDGKPMTGSLLAYESQGDASPNGCGNLSQSTTATLSTVAYDLANTSGNACSLIFKSGY